tara:strand:+ start:263 stop:787 length:525 start_codon:yes stop_codon:yes gene_type:complete
MNRYQFEDLISDYLENELSLSKRKEFEAYIENNQDAEKLVESISLNMDHLKSFPRIKTKTNFNENLLQSIKNKKLKSGNSGKNGMIFGFSVMNATFLTALFTAFIFVTIQLFDLHKKNDSDYQDFIVKKKSTEDRMYSKPILDDLAISKNDSISNDSISRPKKDMTGKIQLVKD